ncbi:hypothetical protein HYPSUDRAFT_45461 [Hypholoma sublateritium FD-334 SS-4]|uniref:Uncharacterized protein n=1 Tax=Hypholoma sublateritium (strain FD-334 SS-4) TaxID=945553 RepID=A0A0D2M540_HYPSF|nr:hypothetical protein HYPSUDRAFT_45461 [Hypholoma sublateritium FD-334 SS-4]
MSHAAEPLKVARATALTLAWCFSVIASSVGLNGLIKSNQQKSKIRKLAPSPTVVYIDTADIFNVGVLATTVSLILAILASKSLVGMFVPFTKRFIERTLRVQSYIGFLFTVLLFGSMVPYTVYFATRHAQVTAFIGATQLPDSIIKAAEQASGSTSIYKDIDYLRLVTIFGWISLFFNLIACTVLFKAGGVVPKAQAAPLPVNSSPTTTVKEEPSAHIEEKGTEEV